MDEISKRGRNGLPRPILGFQSIAAMCRHHSISADTWKRVERERPEASAEDRLEICKERKGRHHCLGYRSGKQMCEAESICNKKWRQYRSQYPQCTNAELLGYIKRGEVPPYESVNITKKRYDINSDNGLSIKPIKRGFYVVEMNEASDRKTNY